MYKKILAAMFCVAGVTAPLFADVAPNPDSGKQRIMAIMSNLETGIAAYNKKHIHYAETQNLAQDLNVPEIAKFFGCKTLVGEAFLTETLSCPVAPQDRDTVLRDRQNAVRALVENPEFKKNVEALLNEAHRYEQDVIALFSEQFVGKTCPELQQLELIKKQNPGLYPIFNFFHVNPTGKIVSTSLSVAGFVGLTYSAKVLGKAAYISAKYGFPYGKLAFWTAYMGLIAGVQGHDLYDTYTKAAEKRSKMHALNQFITIAEDFERLCAKYDVKNQFNLSDIKDPQGIALVKGLKHARYQGKNTWFFSTPSVHTFLYQVYQGQARLAEVFACIAEIDTYHAIATKILESKNSKDKFCFVTFVDQVKPVVKTQGFWNVLVKDAVPSDLCESKHIILTGPNAGGKTTAIRALLQNIVLGQSYGVAAATTFEFTMFDIVHSYLNISDDISKKLSLFASEVKRAQDVLQRMKTLAPGTKYFFALDELFTGTVAEDGEKCAYEFVKRISDFPGVQFVYATHFNKLKELGDKNPVCANYKVDAPTKNAAGKLVYPYTLSQGANQSNVALDLAREAKLFA